MKPMGIMAHYEDVIFKKNGVEIYKSSGSLGCLRHGEPRDSYDLVRQGLARLNEDVQSGRADVMALGYDSVRVRNHEFTRDQLIRAGVIEAPKKTVCKFPNGPKPKR